MLLLEKYLVFAVLLPSFLIIAGRWLFAFYYPVNVGSAIASYQNHQQLVASRKAIRIFISTNTTLLLASFIIFCAIVVLPFVDRFYHIGLTTDDIVILFKVLIPLYALWFLTLFTTGFLYGGAFFDDLFYNDPEVKFYSITLDENYKIIIRIPEQVGKDTSMLFDNEKKKTDRMNLHKSLIKEYKAQKNDIAVNALFEAVKINKEDIEKYKKARERGGHKEVFLKNLNESGSKLLVIPLMPAIFFYLTIVEIFVSIFPALSKMYEKNQATEQVAEEAANTKAEAEK